jgi:hypothetical protein
MNFNPVACSIQLRKLLGARKITPHEYAVGDVVLWRCRASGRDTAQVSYKRIAQLACLLKITDVANMKQIEATIGKNELLSGGSAQWTEFPDQLRATLLAQ